ncbi:glycosyl transferase family protein-like protein [Clathrospora elynae]|uniref:Glycosyl transferase family protein-like protein n=1 Tax=Clathrospora elynae TaxID=706981 RepID=A0A6A5TAK3_9PLEO|nr:glycosyl transferase family protein-like protein [Clathrospora elynae]
MSTSNLSTEMAGVQSKKVWTTLITNTAYLTGLLTLDYSLKKHGSKYPLVALYTDTFPEEGHKALDERGIPKQHVKYLLPKIQKDFTNDPRFYDCWSKLTPFSLEEYDRVVQLDSDMLVLKNMDELMELELDAPSMAGKGDRVFAASHACVCNPLKKLHYPKDWVPENCAFTSQHKDAHLAQREGAPSTAGLGMPNGGLQVVNPSLATYNLILSQLSNETSMAYDFADQSLLGDLFNGRWVALPYTYNALKTMRSEGVHSEIWRDGEVKNVHYILSPKPWDEEKGKSSLEVHEWWWVVNNERLEKEKGMGVSDGF